MSDEKISGIQGAQGKAQASATTSRTTGKNRLMKFAMYFASFICLSILWRAVDFGGMTETSKIANKSRVTAHQVVIPAKGIVRIKRDLRCNVDNISNEDMRSIKRIDEQNDVVYVSEHDREVRAKVWFFDEGGVCTSDVHKLVAERVFM